MYLFLRHDGMAAVSRVPTMRTRNTLFEEDNPLARNLNSGVLFHEVGAGRPCLKCGAYPDSLSSLYISADPEGQSVARGDPLLGVPP